MARLVSEGFGVQYTPGSDVAAGTIVKVGSIVGVANHNIPANTLGSIETHGIYEITKAASSTTFTQGAAVYYNTSGLATATNTDTFFGYAAKASANGDEAVVAVLAPAGVVPAT